MSLVKSGRVIDHTYPIKDRCSHGKPWAVDCAECELVWRAERIEEIRARAAAYGFKLVPIETE